MNIHSIIPNSKVNGPSNRFVIWTQGCSLNCYGCWNPDTHTFKGAKYYIVDYIFDMIIKEPNIEGVTISGGEPFEQTSELFKLTKLIKDKTNLSQIIYSGYTLKEIEEDIMKGKILSNIDVLIDGRYNAEKLSKNGAIGSTNQRHHFFTNRYSLNDFQKQNRLEYLFNNDGSTSLTGFPMEIES